MTLVGMIKEMVAFGCSVTNLEAELTYWTSGGRERRGLVGGRGVATASVGEATTTSSTSRTATSNVRERALCFGDRVVPLSNISTGE